ncbi:MAG: 5-formyltetrahydrofolate cyclo-ligase [Lachnospiraceae bacterium]
MEKKQIRKKIREQRAHLTQEEIEARSRQICRRILDMEAFQKASCLYTYIDCKGEASTRLLMEEAWKLGKEWQLQKYTARTWTIFISAPWKTWSLDIFRFQNPKRDLQKQRKKMP